MQRSEPAPGGEREELMIENGVPLAEGAKAARTSVLVGRGGDAEPGRWRRLGWEAGCRAAGGPEPARVASRRSEGLPDHYRLGRITPDILAVGHPKSKHISTYTTKAASVCLNGRLDRSRES